MVEYVSRCDFSEHRVSVAEVHHAYRTSSEHGGAGSHRLSGESGGREEAGGAAAGLRRWSRQESLERGVGGGGGRSDRRGSDVGSINPTWRDQDDSEGVGFAAVHGYR